MSNAVGCQCRPPMSISSGRISRLLDSTHFYASGRSKHLAIRCELGRPGRVTRGTKLRKVKLSRGILHSEIRVPLFPSSTSTLGRPVAASNSDSATQAAEQLSQYFKDLGKYVNQPEDIQNSVNQSIVALAEKASEISTSVASSIRSQTSGNVDLKSLQSLQEAFGNVSQSLSSVASSIRSQTSGSVDLKSLEPLQEAFGNVSQSLSSAASSIRSQTSDLKSLESLQEAFGNVSQSLSKSTAAFPKDFTSVQGQIDQIASTLNSNLKLEALQASVESARQSLTAALQEASSSPRVSTSILNGTGKGSSLEHVAASLSNVLHNAQVLAIEVGNRVVHLPTSGIHFDASSISAPLEQAFSRFGTSLSGIPSAGLAGNMDSSALVASALLVTLATSGAVVSSFKLAEVTTKSFVEGQDLPLRYDAAKIGAYFRKRPLDIFLRSLRILFSCSTLVFNILLDKYVGRDQELEQLRATQMVELIAGLGPTAIKIGQALSIRPDILPVVYLEELQKLQDRVPPFSNEDAKRLIREGLGKQVEDIFSELSSEPIAAASLGQVYKGRLRETGDIVAVKVQRPGVLEGISRDLFLLRQGARVLELIPTVQSDLVALIDTWAFRFFDELDYVQEARNAIRFAEDMKLLPNVTVPGVYLSYTSRKVLTSVWVDGEKLSETKAADLLPLIRTALNCYLMQLLESGFLHADPHPGNLLRTPDGRLCVLDFGLMTEVTEDQRYTLIEYISHLVNSDYARVAEDLVRLGFVPPEFVDPEKTAAVVPQLSRVLGQLTQGGGARKVNVQQITNDLANISKDYVFVIPPYFALILRAFSVLEGIGLDADPDYTIVDECYPYISKRLLTDDSPRTRVALQYFLYGGKSQLDATRVEEIISGFQNFRELMVPATAGDGPAPKLEPIDPATKEALLLLFSPEGSFVQDLLLTELVRTVDALSRQAVAELWRSITASIRIPLPAGLRIPGSWPLPLPGLFLGSSPTARLTEEDVKSLETVRRIWTLVEPQFRQRNSFADIVEVVQDGLPFFRDLLPGVTTSAAKFFMLLLQRQALRLADDLEAANTRKPVSHFEDAVHSPRTSTPILPAPVRVREATLLEDKLNRTPVLQLEAKDELQQETTVLQLEGAADGLEESTVLELEGVR